LCQTPEAEGLYEGMNITGVKGLSEEAIATLVKLGANSSDAKQFPQSGNHPAAVL